MKHRTQGNVFFAAAIVSIGAFLCIGCERESEPSGGLTPTPARVQPPQPVDDSTEAGSARFAGVATDVPEHWIREQPASSMRAAQFRIPGTGEIPDDLEVAVFAGIFGSNDDNIARWVGQFSTADGNSVEPTLEQFDANGMNVVLVAISGTYSGMSPRGAATEPRANTGFIAAIVEGPESILHIRLVGQLSAVEANRDEFVSFVKGLKPVDL